MSHKPFIQGRAPGKPYSSPRLSVFGRLADLTREDSGDGADSIPGFGSRPATRPNPKGEYK